jgi:flagellar motor switch protein FliN/FliY
MGDGSLSQDEIDALLQGADDMLSSSGSGMGGMGGGMSPASSGGNLSPVDRETLSDLLGGVMGAVAPSLSGYLTKNIRISNPVVEVKSRDALVNDFPKQYVVVSMNYTGALSGKNVIILGYNDAGIIASLMIGDDTGNPPAELSEAHQSTLQEFVSQLLSSGATQIGERTGRRNISTTPPNLSIAGNGNEIDFPMGDCAKVTYNLSIEGLVNSKIYQIMDLAMASDMSKSTRGGGSSGGGGMGSGGGGGFQNQSMGGGMGGGVGIAPVKFPPLGEGVPQGVGQNINLLLDVQLTLTVELGRTKQYVKDILGLGEGSIIELDKLAGEPVDLLVNNKLIAKGEVVVIDENFGVRVTDIVSPSERLSKIGQGG